MNYLIFGFIIIIELINLVHLEFYSMWKFAHQFIKLFLIFIIVDVIKDKKNIEKGIFAWIITAVISVIISLIALYTKWDFLKRCLNGDIIVGISNDWHIDYAVKLYFTFSFLLLWILENIKKLSKTKLILSILSLVILLTGGFYTGSRGALIGLFLTSIIFLFIKKYRKVFIIVFVLSIVIGTITYFTSKNLNQRLQKNAFESASHFRLKNYIRVIKNWDKFILGFGTGNHQKAMSKVFPNEDTLPCHMHNNILQYFVEYGVLGVIIYFIFWIGIFYYIFIHIKKYNWIIIAGIWSILIFQLAGLTQANWVIATMQFSICYIIGIVIVITKKLNNQFF